MENLKSGDVPALVTNIEVMHILSNRIQTRQEEASGPFNNNSDNQPTTITEMNGSNNINNNHHRRHGKLRHRDYIEESVYHYLSYSACAGTNVQKMPDLVRQLRKGRDVVRTRSSSSSNKKKCSQSTQNLQQDRNQMIKKEDTQTTVKEEEDYHHHHNHKDENDNENDGDDDDGEPNFGLTDSETLQIVNLMPTTPVEIHLMIEDLANRLNEEEQGKLTELISQYAGTVPTSVEEAEEGGEEEDGE